MKLLRVRIISARTCGGLLDDLNVQLRSPSNDHPEFKPLCMIGPNGAGKSQFLQTLAEIFQSILHACVPTEERIESNPNIQFEIEYLIFPANAERPVRVRALRESTNKKKAVLLIQRREGAMQDCWVVQKL
jgi:ABC-type cobalamin/Fe3+-siderophores transport system ATPase subunit